VRPVNLIPVDQRRGDHSPLRTGPLPYLVLGALALVLVGAAMTVLTDNQVDERKAEVATLQAEDAAAKAKAEELAAYVAFKTMSEQRVATVMSLADSRFDWERVMRELALILPDDAWLVSLDASAGATAGGEEGSGDISGPSLELSGCAAGQNAVAGFVTALKDIDGVTRVGVTSSELAARDANGGGGEDCRTREFIAQFSVVVAFDAAPAPAVAEGTSEAPAAEEAEGDGEEEEEEAAGE
jgi:Tfp pilus assembly protein PilN